MFSKNRYQSLIVIFLLWCIVTAFNLTKAVHIDDTVYLEMARHIRSDPLHPMSGQINWSNTAEPIYSINQPPFMCYLYALTMSVFGDSEIALHFLLSLFSLGAIYLFFILARQFAPQNRLILTATFCLGPVFIPGQNLMMDIPVVALWLTFFVLVFNKKIKPLFRYIFAAVILSIAFLIKYTSLILMPILFFDILQKRDWRFLWTGCVPVIILFGWSLFNIYDYGGIHILGRPVSPPNLMRLGYGLTDWLVCVGAVCPFSIILIPPRRDRLAWLGLLLLAAAAFLFIIYNSNNFNLGRPTSWRAIFGGIFFGNGVLLFASTLYYGARNCIVAYREKRQNEKSCHIIFLAWLLGAMAFIVLFAPFVAVRHILIVVPVVLLILNIGVFVRMAKKWLVIGMLATVFLGVTLGISDWIYADTYRVQAKKIGEKLRTKRENTIWYLGHWGWQWYASREGLKLYDYKLAKLKVGDILVVPHLVDKQLIRISPLCRLKWIDLITVHETPFTFFRSMADRPIGGLYYHRFMDGSLPWRITKASLEKFSILEFECPDY